MANDFFSVVDRSQWTGYVQIRQIRNKTLMASKSGVPLQGCQVVNCAPVYKWFVALPGFFHNRSFADAARAIGDHVIRDTEHRGAACLAALTRRPSHGAASGRAALLRMMRSVLLVASFGSF